MKFLDLNGLTYFWNKIKTFISDNYLSLNGGKIKGIVNFLNKNDTTEYISIDSSSINNSKYPPHYLFANGKMVPIGEANGVASLDSEGNVPLQQLGNLDTTVAEVVTSLPKANIKKHIYLIKVSSETQNQYEEYPYTGETQNQYEEYLYTGDTSAEYDASKWEKLGNFRPTIDLADYAKKSETISKLIVDTQYTGAHTKRQYIAIYKAGSSSYESEAIMLEATTNMSGFMSAQDKSKLDGIELNANDYSLPLAADNTRGGIKVGYQDNSGFPVKLDSEERAYVTIPIATQDKNGLFSYTDQKKLDGIASGATADSAITTAEIDELFA